MGDDVDEREMNVLRQRALSTLPSKRNIYRKERGSDFIVDSVISGVRNVEERGCSHIEVGDKHSQYQLPASVGDIHHPAYFDNNKQKRVRKRARVRDDSSSRSPSPSSSRSYSSYSSSGSSTSGSRSHSSSSASQSSYSSYTRSSYSSRRSFSTSPAQHRTKNFSVNNDSHIDPSSKFSSSKTSSHRSYPPSSQWHEHHPPSHLYTSSRSPLPSRKGYSTSSHSSSLHYPPAKRRPHADYHNNRENRSGSRHHFRDSLPPPPPPLPPPPPPPSLLRNRRVVHHMKTSRSFRSPPPYTNRRSAHGPRDPSRYRSPRYKPHRRSFSPPLLSSRVPRDVRPRRALVADSSHFRPSSRDLQSLCGPPIHVRDRYYRKSTEEHTLRSLDPASSRPSNKSTDIIHSRSNPKRRQESSSSIRSKSKSTRSNIDSRKSKVKSAEDIDKVRSARDGERNISSSPSLNSPSAQLLWDNDEVEAGKDTGERTKVEDEDGDVEELDYDETMDDLDLHPTGNIDEGDLNVPPNSEIGTMSWDDSEHENKIAEDKVSSNEIKKDNSADTPDGGDTVCTPCTVDKNKVHISSPIRVSPARAEPRVVHHSPRRPYKKEDSRLPAKERLYVSKNAIVEKKLRMDRHSEDCSSKLPRSLANRLGPSPGFQNVVKRRSAKSGHHKGSALAIAAEYKRKKQAGELSPQGITTTKKNITSKYASENSTSKHKKQEERSEENERELDKRINSIKQRNKAIERRHMEVEKDKQRYG